MAKRANRSFRLTQCPEPHPMTMSNAPRIPENDPRPPETAQAGGEVVKRGQHIVPAEEVEHFSTLLTEITPALSSYLSTMLRDRSEIEDCMQEAFVVVWEKFNPEWDVEEFRRYSFTCARFKAMNLLRKRSSRALVFMDPKVSELMDERIRHVAEDESTMLYKKRMRALEQCIGQLGKEQRKLLHARYGSDTESLEDLSMKLSRKLPAIYKQLERLRSALKNCVEMRMKRAET